MRDLLTMLHGSAETGVPQDSLPAGAKQKLPQLKELLETKGKGTIRTVAGRCHLLLGREIFRDYGDRKICRACNLSKPQQVPYRGPLDAEIVIVGEAPGKEEEAQGRPFAGPTGQEVNACLRYAGLSEQEILFCNPLCCRPDWGIRPGKQDILTCSRLFLYRWLGTRQRKLIIALGNSACYALGVSTDLTGIQSRRGVPVWSDEWNCLLLPVLHPASMLKASPNEMTVRTLASDFVRAATLKKKGYEFKRPEVHVDIAWLLEQFDDWRYRCEQADLIAVDIETTGKDFHQDRILSVALSVDDKEAFVVPIECRLVTLTSNATLLKELDNKWPEQKPSWYSACYPNRPTTYEALCNIPEFDPAVHNRYLRPLKFHCYWNSKTWAVAYDFLRYVLAELPVPKTMQNGNFDAKFLRHQYGIEVKPFSEDTIILHQLLDENGQHGLDAIAADVLGYMSHKDTARDLYRTVCKHWGFPVGCGDYSLIPPKVLHQYNGEDTAVQWACTKELRSRLTDEGPEMTAYYEKLIMPVWHSVRRMEERGIAVDPNLLSTAENALENASAELLAALKGESGIEDFNPRSTPQLREVLYGKFKLPIPRDDEGKPMLTKGGDPSTDEKALQFLEGLRSDFITALQSHRSAEKLLGSYVRKIRDSRSPVTGRIHPQYAFAADRDWMRDTDYGAKGTRTGRLSASGGIAIQTVPKSLRPIFWAGPGRVFIECDYKNAELRVWAALSGDPELTRAVLAQDVHRAFAARIFNLAEEQITTEQRAVAKTFVFASGYGAEPYTLASRAGISVEKAEAILTSMKRSFSRAYEWMAEQSSLAEANGYVKTFLGRKRRPAGLIYVDRKIRSAAARQCGNSPVQGTALEVCFVGWLKAEKALRKARLDVHAETQVHDSVLFSCPEADLEQAREIIVTNMTDPLPQLGVPMAVELEENTLTHWGGNLDVDKVLD